MIIVPNSNTSAKDNNASWTAKWLPGLNRAYNKDALVNMVNVALKHNVPLYIWLTSCKIYDEILAELITEGKLPITSDGKWDGDFMFAAPGRGPKAKTATETATVVADTSEAVPPM